MPTFKYTLTLASDMGDGQTSGSTRALITDTEREQLAGEHSDDRRYQAASRVRRRVNERLGEDISILEQHHTKLLKEVKEVICNED